MLYSKMTMHLSRGRINNSLEYFAYTRESDGLKMNDALSPSTQRSLNQSGYKSIQVDFTNTVISHPNNSAISVGTQVAISYEYAGKPYAINAVKMTSEVRGAGSELFADRFTDSNGHGYEVKDAVAQQNLPSHAAFLLRAIKNDPQIQRNHGIEPFHAQAWNPAP